MKTSITPFKLIMALFILIKCTTSFSQVSGMYFGNNAMWVKLVTMSAPSSSVSGTGHDYEYRLYKYVGDSIINNNTYKVISMLYPYIKRFLLRDSAGIVFLRDYTGTYKIIDWTPNSKNDTITLNVCASEWCNNLTPPTNKKLVIDSIWYDTSTGISYKILYARDISPLVWHHHTIFIERIGTEKFINNDCCGSCVGATVGECLRCFSSNDTIYYLNTIGNGVHLPGYEPPLTLGDCGCAIKTPSNVNNIPSSSMGRLVRIPGRCDTIKEFGFTTGIKEQTRSFILDVYPTIVADHFWITRDMVYKDKWEWELLNPIGEIIKEGNIESNKQTIDIQELHSGIYILVIKNKDKCIIDKRKIIKL